MTADINQCSQLLPLIFIIMTTTTTTTITTTDIIVCSINMVVIMSIVSSMMITIIPMVIRISIHIRISDMFFIISHSTIMTMSLAFVLYVVVCICNTYTYIRSGPELSAGPWGGAARTVRATAAGAVALGAVCGTLGAWGMGMRCNFIR